MLPAAMGTSNIQAHVDFRATCPLRIQRSPPHARNSVFLTPWASHAGHIVYHGDREGCMPFFTSMGFQLPARKGVPEFLQEVTSRKDQAVSTSLTLSMRLLICACNMYQKPRTSGGVMQHFHIRLRSSA